MVAPPCLLLGDLMPYYLLDEGPLGLFFLTGIVSLSCDLLRTTGLITFDENAKVPGGSEGGKEDGNHEYAFRVLL